MSLKDATLYDFQKEAVEMMLDRGSLLLTHEMGLGKTVSSIAAAEALIDAREADQVLVVCPASIKWQWKRQIEKFTDGAVVLVVEGNKNERWAQYRQVRRGDVEYVIVNYEQVVADWDTLRHFTWDVVICDEVTYIKSPNAKRTRHVRRIQAPYKFGLTGQPIENRPEELYSIMQWVDPTVLGDPKAFERAFIVRDEWGGPKYYKNLKTLREIMEKAMHRRTRADVANQMPDIVEKEFLIEFDAPTKKLYDRIARELISVLRGAQSFSSWNLMDHYSGTDDKWMNAEVMPRLMALRMLCDHPQLLTYSADNFEDPDTQAGSRYAADLVHHANLRTNQAALRSQKLEVTLEVIEDLLAADPRNKVVLFSFFKPMLAIISERLSKKRIKHELFTGDLSPKERDEAKEVFTNNPRCRVLLSSDAGGIGVDLPIANFLISYDLPWSAGKFAQRQGRIVRISSEFPEVTLISMVMKGSIEEWMLDVLDQKMAVAAAWLDGDGVDHKGRFELTVSGLCDYLESA